MPSWADGWTSRRCARPSKSNVWKAGRSARASAACEFTVRIDRVDRLEDGRACLIDYKSGAADVDWRGDRPDNPQLPIYALLLPQALVAVAYGRINASECSFRGRVRARRKYSSRGPREPRWRAWQSLAALDGVVVAAHRDAGGGVCRGARRGGSAAAGVRVLPFARPVSCPLIPIEMCQGRRGPPPGHRGERIGPGAGAGGQRQDHAAGAALFEPARLERCAGAHSGADLHQPRGAGDARARDRRVAGRFARRLCPPSMNRQTWSLAAAAKRHLQARANRYRTSAVPAAHRDHRCVQRLAGGPAADHGGSGRSAQYGGERARRCTRRRRGARWRMTGPIRSGRRSSGLLALDDQRWRRLVELIAEMLPSRDRWLPLLAGRLQAASSLDEAQLRARAAALR